MLIFSFKKSAQALFGPIEGNGIIEGIGVEGVPVFVMPGPYAKRDVVVTDSRSYPDLRRSALVLSTSVINSAM